MWTLKYFSNIFNFLLAHKKLRKTPSKVAQKYSNFVCLTALCCPNGPKYGLYTNCSQNWVLSVERAELLSSLLLFTGGVEIKVTVKNSPQKAAQFRLFYASQGALTMHKLWPLSRNLTWKMNKITP